VVHILAERQWRARRAAHESIVDGLLAGHLDRARRQEKHPVEDFLFTYYSHRPARLRRWHPGAGTALAGDASEYAGLSGYSETPRGVTAVLTDRRRDTVGWVHGLLTATAGRPAQFGCFGLHEWAMVYRAEEVRHSAVPLRLGSAGTDEVVESLPIRCSHFDAFRFFTPQARGLNVLQPTRESQPALEQPGCLHATMDLYKWAYKLEPLTPSELVLDCFRLAKDVRELDMRASPYDLAAAGYPPVRIETPEGRAEYTAAQRGFAERGQALRERLTAVCETALAGTDAAVSG
jgi:hypothetical protein